jgi:hypothetical protein
MIQAIQWLEGGATSTRIPTVEEGDEFLVAVRLVDRKTREEFWEYTVVSAASGVLEVDALPWDRTWDDVDFYVPTRMLMPAVTDDVLEAL